MSSERPFGSCRQGIAVGGSEGWLDFPPLKHVKETLICKAELNKPQISVLQPCGGGRSGFNMISGGGRALGSHLNNGVVRVINCWPGSLHQPTFLPSQNRLKKPTWAIFLGGGPKSQSSLKRLKIVGSKHRKDNFDFEGPGGWREHSPLKPYIEPWGP